MAVDINSLVRTIGGQEKVIDKDKALIELANAIENGGGGGSIVEIKKIWGVSGDAENPTFTEIQPTTNTEQFIKFDLDLSQASNYFQYIGTTDENTPDFETEQNICIFLDDTFVAYKNVGTIAFSAGFNNDTYKVQVNNSKLIEITISFVNEA